MSLPQQIKADVVNELRNEIHYDQLALRSLLNTPNLNHKKTVKKVKKILKNIVAADKAIELFELYLPEAPAAKIQDDTNKNG